MQVHAPLTEVKYGKTLSSIFFYLPIFHLSLHVKYIKDIKLNMTLECN